MAYIAREVVAEEYIATDSRQIVDRGVDRYRTYEHTQHDTNTLAADIIQISYTIVINCI